MQRNHCTRTCQNKPRLIFCHTLSTVSAHTGQCDCACAATLQAVDHVAAPSDNAVYRTAPGATVPVTANYTVRLGQAHPAVVMNNPALGMFSHFQQPRSLAGVPTIWRNAWGESHVNTTLAQMRALGLLVPESRALLPLIETPTLLSAWLHLTDHCTLRCDYCYLPHARADMSPATGRAAIDATFRSAVAHGYRAVKLKYAGGEPLLRFSLAVELHRYAHALAQQHGLALDGVILSNGTLLTAAMVETMQAEGLRLMLSLDGLGAFHDSQRRFPDGRGSFDAVARAVDCALAGGLVPDISITVSGRNAAGLPDVVAWVLERDLPFSLNFYREHNGSDWQSDLQLDEARIIEGMLAAYKVIEGNLPRRSLLASLADRANLAAPHQRVCSVGQSYLVFDTEGHVAPCQMALGQTFTDCHAPDPLAVLHTNATGLQNPVVDEKEGCRACEWRYWCAGGCPLQAYRAAGRYDAKSPNCNIYKALYPEVVRLEGLRLLKYAEAFVPSG